MRKLYFFLTLFAGLALAVGCENNPQDEDKPQPPTPSTTPEITLEQAALECNSFTFTVTTNVEGELGYAVVAEGNTMPKIDELFALNSAEVKDTATLTVSDLNDNTAYTLVAILRAKEDGILSEPAKLQFTTPDDGIENPIVIDEVTYSTVTFTINIAGDYLFQCIDKAYLEHNGQTPESYISTMGIGIPEKGVQTYEWIDGSKYGSYDMHLREDSEYYVIAAISDGKQNVTGDIFVKPFRTPKRPVSEAGMTIELKDINSSSVTIATTPDTTVAEYYVWVETQANIEYYVQVGGSESFLNSLIKNANAGSWHLTQANEQTWSGLVPDTDYYCLVYLIDNKGSDMMQKVEFRTSGKQLGEPQGEVSVTPASENPHKTLNINIFSEDAEYVKVAFNTAADIQEQRNNDRTDSDIARLFGFELNAEQVEAVRTTGLSLINEELWPDTEYIAVVSIKNAEQTETVICASGNTPKKALPTRVESDLFDTLQGEWLVSYELVQVNGVSVSITDAKVTIAAGADDKSAKEYRDYNRLVVLGWPFDVTSQGVLKEIPYYSPADLLDASSYWRNYESLAYRDYGPKIFLEIGEGDTITIPSERNHYLYNWGSDGYVLYFFGADYSSKKSAPATFPVTLSEDGDTLTIGAHHSGAEFDYGVYRPSVFRNMTEMWAVATSDIVLKRVK